MKDRKVDSFFPLGVLKNGKAKVDISVAVPSNLLICATDDFVTPMLGTAETLILDRKILDVMQKKIFLFAILKIFIDTIW